MDANDDTKLLSILGQQPGVRHFAAELAQRFGMGEGDMTLRLNHLVLREWLRIEVDARARIGYVITAAGLASAGGQRRAGLRATRTSVAYTPEPLSEGEVVNVRSLPGGRWLALVRSRDYLLDERDTPLDDLSLDVVPGEISDDGSFRVSGKGSEVRTASSLG